MIRRLLLLCALGALASESAYGLGLGKLELHSALNQEFDAEIELTNVRGLGIDEILPSLASTEDFDRAGIERTYMLTDLRFKAVQKEDGRLAVRITSTRPIVEPFLNFIVEVLWPSGRILREYTVLLDPPVFGQAGVQPLKSAETRRPAGQITSGPQERPGPVRSEPTPAPGPASTPPATPPTGTGKAMHEGTLANGEYGMTGRGDTLWSIALKVRPNRSVSVQQTMLAILRANPEAFISDNINLLKAGYVLRVPDLAEMEKETLASAVREVQMQNDEFEAYRNGTPIAQLDASKRQKAAGNGPGSSDEGELRLVASDKSGNEAAGGEDDAAANAATEQLQNELAVAREDLDRARRASSELNVRIRDLQGQINTLNNLVKLKDDQLAALRTEIQKVQAAARAQAQQTQQAPASRPATPSIGSVTTKLMNQGSLLSNPYVLGLLALLVVAGVAGALIFMRRRAQADVLGAGDFDVVDMDEDEFDVADPDDHIDEVEVESVLIEEDDDELEAQTTDVIGEAEIYIAYGRFPQAITFLQNAIEEEPDRTDIQLKLLEVYVQTEDANAFNRQLERLKRTGDQDAISEALALQMAIPGAAEAAEASMGATMVSSEPVAEDDFSFDLDDLGAETEEDNFDLNAELDLDDSEGELELDLDLDADSSEEEPELVLDDIELDLDGEDLSLDDDDGIELSLGDDDDLELNLDEDASTKLDLARAYIDMGDSDGARNVLEEVIQEGSDSEIQEANELLAKID